MRVGPFGQGQMQGRVTVAIVIEDRDHALRLPCVRSRFLSNIVRASQDIGGTHAFAQCAVSGKRVNHVSDHWIFSTYPTNSPVNLRNRSPMNRLAQRSWVQYAAPKSALRDKERPSGSLSLMIPWRWTTLSSFPVWAQIGLAPLQSQPRLRRRAQSHDQSWSSPGAHSLPRSS